jgi:SAM-dependent methyltransferase
MHNPVPVLYDRIGTRYRNYRRPDARIAAAILGEIGDAGSILNVGAGIGAYELGGRDVVAVEPSSVMISQRPRNGAPVVQARAESLPFKDYVFDVATAILTIHHWSDIEKGLREARRVTKGRLVLLTWIGVEEQLWLFDYLPQISEIDKTLFPSLEELEQILGSIQVLPVPIPHDCTDGFLCAYWRRPHAYLDAGVRSAISTFSRITDVRNGLRRLREDLQSGSWHQRYQYLLTKESMDCGYRIVVSE